MKTNKIVLGTIATASIIFLAACSSTKKTASSAPVAEVHFTAAELEEGKLIMESSCKRCHKLYEPESHTPKQWDKILPRMNKRAKLSPDQAAKVRGHIMSLAKK